MGIEPTRTSKQIAGGAPFAFPAFIFSSYILHVLHRKRNPFLMGIFDNFFTNKNAPIVTSSYVLATYIYDERRRNDEDHSYYYAKK